MVIARVKYKDSYCYAKLSYDQKSYKLLRGDLCMDMPETGVSYSCKDLKLLSPCVPTKIIAVGLNYADHAREMNLVIPPFPALFIKPTSSVIGPDDSIVCPPMSKRVDYEAELAVVIGKTASCIDPKSAREYILGYTCLNDVTARDLQKVDQQWTRAKGFDTFCPMGPHIVTGLNGNNLHIELRLNGKVMQSSDTSNLIFKVEELVSMISHVMTLYPGDVISTGTPSGIGQLRPGDTVEVIIDGIGVLRNTVKEYEK